jgi:hypothetical protein
LKSLVFVIERCLYLLQPLAREPRTENSCLHEKKNATNNECYSRNKDHKEQ